MKLVAETDTMSAVEQSPASSKTAEHWDVSKFCFYVVLRHVFLVTGDVVTVGCCIAISVLGVVE